MVRSELRFLFVRLTCVCKALNASSLLACSAYTCLLKQTRKADSQLKTKAVGQLEANADSQLRSSQQLQYQAMAPKKKPMTPKATQKKPAMTPKATKKKPAMTPKAASDVVHRKRVPMSRKNSARMPELLESDEPAWVTRAACADIAASCAKMKLRRLKENQMQATIPQMHASEWGWGSNTDPGDMPKDLERAHVEEVRAGCAMVKKGEKLGKTVKVTHGIRAKNKFRECPMNERVEAVYPLENDRQLLTMAQAKNVLFKKNDEGNVIISHRGAK